MSDKLTIGQLEFGVGLAVQAALHNFMRDSIPFTHDEYKRVFRAINRTMLKQVKTVKSIADRLEHPTKEAV